ncbi:MAG: glycosyltransferase family 2 protein [Nitrospirota bacterium]|nr:glycosyltransferase family 2 protein [Nitrospirota bacterium]
MQTPDTPYLSVVLPIYNEEESIPVLLSRITAALDPVGKPYEIVCVNDGSSDSSLSLLQDAAGKNPRIRIVNFRKNHGQTAAFDAGFHAARGEVVVTMDADLQNDPADIPRLLEKMKDYDVVCGWRQKRNDPWIRLFSSRIANGVRNWLSDETITDTGCSLKAFRREHLLRLKLFNGMHRFLPTLLKMEGCSVVEVPVSHHPRQYGVSKYGIGNRLFKGIYDLIAVRWMKKRYLAYRNDMEIL